MKRNRIILSPRRACAALAMLAALGGCASPAPHAADASKSAAPGGAAGWMRSEVADAYVYAYPLVLMDVAKEDALGADGAGTNTLRAAPPLPLAGADTLDSTAWLDVSAQPVIVTLPNSHGRYLDARALDMWTNVLWSSGPTANARTGMSPAQTIAFVRAGWHGTLPAHVKRVDVPGRNVWLAVRIEASGRRDRRAEHLQRAIRVELLSDYADGAHRARAAELAQAPAESAGSPVAQVAALDPQAFFTRAARAMKDDPPAAADTDTVAELRDIGVSPGAPVTWSDRQRAAAEQGMAEGRSRVAAPPPNLLAANGWNWVGDGAGAYGDDYLLRAYVASTRFGAATHADETVALASVDSEGRPLDGAYRYAIRFTRRAMPPVRAFWALEPYTPNGEPARIERGRRSIGSRDRLRRNRDGSIDVYVSAASPGRARASNWLPAPRGGFELALRLYAPRPQAMDGGWEPPAIVRR